VAAFENAGVAHLAASVCPTLLYAVGPAVYVSFTPLGDLVTREMIKRGVLAPEGDDRGPEPPDGCAPHAA
jgi:hypothetical protein